MSLLTRMVRRLAVQKDAGDLEDLLGPYRGDRVRIDACSRCQLGCPVCPTASGACRSGSVGWGALALGDFTRFLAANPAVRHVELSNYGEIFLNPELAGILAHAQEKGVEVEADGGVNLNHASEEQLEAVVRHGLRRLVVSIDGASQETYGIYRSGGSLDRVLSNVRGINGWKERLGASRPRLVWQFIVFGHNEHELPAARRLAEDLGMGFRPKRNWDPAYSPARDPDFVPRGAKEERRYFLGCRDLWAEPQVNWDGRLLGCCVNYWGDFGNVFAKSLEEVTAGAAYQHAKRVLLGLEKPRPGFPCLDCCFYRDEIRRRPVTREEILRLDLLRRFSDEDERAAGTDTREEKGSTGG